MDGIHYDKYELDLFQFMDNELICEICELHGIIVMDDGLVQEVLVLHELGLFLSLVMD